MSGRPVIDFQLYREHLATAALCEAEADTGKNDKRMTRTLRRMGEAMRQRATQIALGQRAVPSTPLGPESQDPEAPF